MLLAIAYLGVGYGLERLQRRRMASLPLISVAYLLAYLVTSQAIGDTQSLILVLLGDVALLALSGAMFTTPGSTARSGCSCCRSTCS